MKNPEIEKVIQHHLVSFLKADINEVMEDYSEQSTLITPDNEYHGLTQIREFLTELSKYFPTGKSEINLKKLATSNQLGYIVWDAKSPFVDVELATDTFIIENDKIQYQTFAGVLDWH